MPHALWKRCDLHVHTPFDCSRTFGCDVSAAVAAADRGDERQLNEIAEKLFSRCVQACDGEPLHIVGLTDHNSIEGYKRLAPHLDRLGESALAAGKASCVFLPGVEVSIGTERALHINLIFEKQTSVTEIEKLINYIFGKHEPFSEKGEPLSCMHSIEGFFENLNSFCRPTDRKRSISFVAIPSGDLDAGVWESLRGHLRTRGIKHPDWHAFFTKTDYPQLNQRFRELVSEWSELRFERSLEQASPEEKRRVAQRKYWPLLEGSDPHDWEDIGKRFTWMKMQSSDLEGIRLSLLDTESRLRRQAHGCPPDGHTQIKRIRIKSADFIDDLEINFSSALNTLIGGRGSGKSTVLECLRLALDRGRDGDFSRSEEASRASFNRFSKKKEARDFANTAGMILPQTKIEVDLCVNGAEYAVVWTPESHRVDLKGDGWEDLDVRQLLAPRFLSQQQVAEIATDPVAQRRELDAQLNPDRMAELCATIEVAREKVSALQTKRHTLRVHAEKHSGLRTQLKQINDKLALLQSEDNKDALTAFEKFSAESAWLRAQRDQLREVAAALANHVTSLADIEERVPVVDSPASPDLIRKVTAELRATYTRASSSDYFNANEEIVKLKVLNITQISKDELAVTTNELIRYDTGIGKWFSNAGGTDQEGDLVIERIIEHEYRLMNSGGWRIKSREWKRQTPALIQQAGELTLSYQLDEGTVQFDDRRPSKESLDPFYSAIASELQSGFLSYSTFPSNYSVTFDSGGTIGRDEIQGRLSKVHRNVRDVKVTYTIDTVEQKGPTSAEATVRFVAEFIPRDSTVGNRYVAVWRDLDTWTRSADTDTRWTRTATRRTLRSPLWQHYENKRPPEIPDSSGVDPMGPSGGTDSFEGGE